MQLVVVVLHLLVLVRVVLVLALDAAGVERFACTVPALLLRAPPHPVMAPN